MRKIFPIIVTFLYLCAFAVAKDEPKAFVIDAEDFADIGDWRKTWHEDILCLYANYPKNNPVTAFKLEAEGEYEVWAYACDYKGQNGSRKASVIVNGYEGLAPACAHGKKGFEGWQWENLGKAHLNKGYNILSIKTSGAFTRINCIAFASEPDFSPASTPEKFTPKARKLLRVEPFSAAKPVNSIKLEPLAQLKNPPQVSISNGKTQIIYTQKAEASGKLVYERCVKILNGKDWDKIADFGGEALFVGYESKNPNYWDKFYSGWRKPRNYITVKGAKGEVSMPVLYDYPYDFEKCAVLRPTGVKKISERVLELDFDGRVTAVLELAADGAFAKMKAKFAAPEDGFYTLGMLGANPVNRANVTYVALPPLYQLRTLMNSPKQIGNRMTSQPFVIIEVKRADGKIYSAGFAADPAAFPYDEWSRFGNSRYGFSLAAPDGESAQSVIFEPVMGGVNSEKKKGDTLETSWYIFADFTPWTQAVAHINKKIYTGADIFREAYATSFSDALANIIGTLKNEDAGGWSPLLKARWNVEDSMLGTQSSPLSEVSASLLANDEEHYEKIGLATIEFTLSRQGFHFKPLKGHSGSYSATPYKLTVPSETFGADYYSSLNALLGYLNPWLEDFAKPVAASEKRPEWTTKLGSYLAAKEKKPAELEDVKTLCDEWLKTAFSPESMEEIRISAFVNVSYYPFWWYLNDLYEISGDNKYLEYARLGAYHSLISMWNYPTPPSGDVEIYKDNYFYGLKYMWRKGDVFYRLGIEKRNAAVAFFKDSPKELWTGHWTAQFPAVKKTVPALKVSRVGLGIEQPTSYMAARVGGNNMNILMPGWAPEMLGVYKNTGDEALLKFSRHAIIGRYANYPGYYICDYQDEYQDPEYPVRGPDVTSIYYHHIPCSFAHTADYLFTQFEVASKGLIKFPYLRQKGYVWFVDRVFGQAGKVFFEDGCLPIVDKNAVLLDNPKVSVLFARSQTGIWALILNDSAKDLSVKPQFNAASNAMRGAITNEPAKLYDAQGKAVKDLEFFGDKTLDIPAQSLVAIRIPADAANYRKATQPLKSNGHISKAGADALLKDFHAFRIRGPFGKDAAYIVFTGGVEAPKGTKIVMKITSPSAQTVTCERFPFEISVSPLSADCDIKFTVSVIKPDSAAANNLGEFVLGQ